MRERERQSERERVRERDSNAVTVEIQELQHILLLKLSNPLTGVFHFNANVCPLYCLKLREARHNFPNYSFGWRSVPAGHPWSESDQQATCHNTDTPLFALGLFVSASEKCRSKTYTVNTYCTKTAVSVTLLTPNTPHMRTHNSP